MSIEVRESLYTWFQIPRGCKVKQVYFIPWREERIPQLTGGAGCYKITGVPKIFPLACDLKKEILGFPRSIIPPEIPYIKHLDLGHLCWIVCRCWNCNRKWSCVSFNKQPYRKKCRNLNSLPTREQITTSRNS